MKTHNQRIIEVLESPRIKANHLSACLVLLAMSRLSGSPWKVQISTPALAVYLRISTRQTRRVIDELAAQELIYMHAAAHGRTPAVYALLF